MSHFICVVVGNDDLDEQLAPFMENCCGEPEKRFMKFYDEEDEMLETYEKGSQEHIVMPDGRLLLPFDEEFKVPFEKGKIETLGAHKIPENLEKRIVPFKEKYETFEEFAAEWHGRKERDETYNRYGYWENPNAKWDWYEIGGRFSGFWQLKKGSKGRLGKQYNFSGELVVSGNKADRTFKGSIDFEAMRNESERYAAKIYDKIQEVIKGTPSNKHWDSFMREAKTNRETDIEKIRKEYHAQPRVRAFIEYSRSKEGWESIGFYTSEDDFDIPREQYLQNARNHAGVPFAFLKDEKWCEHGEMGWWGISSNEKDPETWNSMYQNMIDQLPDDTILTAVDCHI